MNVLVLNAGSSSLKFSVYAVSSAGEIDLADGLLDWQDPARPAQAELVAHAGGERRVTWEATADHPEARVAEVLRALARLDPPVIAGPGDIGAVGHRVVHGGITYRTPVRIDAQVLAEIDHLSELAPLHNPPAVAGIRAAQTVLPAVPQVAVFDTAFHASLPEAAYVYPFPYQWYADWGVRRFGFHGISHAYCAGRAAELLGRPLSDLRLVNCHQGNGCSLAAIAGGRSVDTTMGFTPLDGVMMGTRGGSIDPGILVYLQRERQVGPDALDDALEHGSGLLGVSGVAADMRTVGEAAAAGNARAQLAIAIFVRRVQAGIAAMAASMGGLDALIFTAGIGEHAAAVRAAICAPLGFMGVAVDATRNAAATPDVEITGPGAAVRVLVIHTQEDRLIARETARVLSLAEGPGGV